METVARVFALFVFIHLALRLVGKRDLSELSPFDLVMVMLIPEIATEALTRADHSVVNAIIGLSTLLSLVFLESLLTYRFPKIRNLVEGLPRVLVKNGKFIEDNVHLERVPPDDIVSEIRTVGLERLDQVKWVVLEADGKLAIVPFRHNKT
jgi:uncharacterized membrane protein YcaP (DUF421 family)